MARTHRSREIEFVENTLATASHAAAVLDGLFQRTHGRQLPTELTALTRDIVSILTAARQRRQELNAGTFVRTAQPQHDHREDGYGSCIPDVGDGS